MEHKHFIIKRSPCAFLQKAPNMHTGARHLKTTVRGKDDLVLTTELRGRPPEAPIAAEGCVKPEKAHQKQQSLLLFLGIHSGSGLLSPRQLWQAFLGGTRVLMPMRVLRAGAFRRESCRRSGEIGIQTLKDQISPQIPGSGPARTESNFKVSFISRACEYQDWETTNPYTVLIAMYSTEAMPLKKKIPS